MGEINKKTNIPPIWRSSFFIREALQEGSLTQLITSLISATAHFSIFRWNFLVAAEFMHKMHGEKFIKPNNKRTITVNVVKTKSMCSLIILNVLKYIDYKL